MNNPNFFRRHLQYFDQILTGVIRDRDDSIGFLHRLPEQVAHISPVFQWNRFRKKESDQVVDGYDQTIMIFSEGDQGSGAVKNMDPHLLQPEG